MAKRNKAHKSGNFELFKRLRNQIVAEVRSAKKNFYHNHVRRTFCTNPHFWWKNVNKIVGKKKQSITLFDPQTEHPMDEKQVAEHINGFFASQTEDFIEVQDTVSG